MLALEPPQRVWSRVWVLKHSVKGRDGMYWCLPAQGNTPHREHPTLPQGRGAHSPHPCPALCPELPRANADLSGSGARLAAIGVVCVEMLLFAAGGPSWQVPTVLLWDQVGSKAAPSMGRSYRGIQGDTLRFQMLLWCNCISTHFTWPLTCSALEAIPALLKGPREISSPPRVLLAQGLMFWYLTSSSCAACCRFYLFTYFQTREEGLQW